MPNTMVITHTGQLGVRETGPTITASWIGTDIDDTDPKKLPVKYHIFFKDVTPAPGIFGVREGASMIRRTLLGGGDFYVSGDTTSYTFKLTVGHYYCLIVKSIDRAGAEEPSGAASTCSAGER